MRRVPGATTTGLTVILHHERVAQHSHLRRNHRRTDAGTISIWSTSRIRSHFHFSSYYLQKGLRREVTELFQRSKAKGLTISLDTNDDPDDRWEGGLKEVLPLCRCIPAERARSVQSCRDGRSGSRDSKAVAAGFRWLW